MNAEIGAGMDDRDNLSLVEIAERHIRQLIETKMLQPGELIDFGALERKLKISRTPIRESIRHLHSSGLLDSSSGGQFRVAKLTKSKVNSFYIVRLRLEEKATELAAGSISKPEIDLLRQNLEIYEANMDQHKLIPRIDSQFHEIIYDGARNRYLANRLKSLRSVLGLLPIQSFSVSSRVTEIYEEHSQILDALERRDEQAAVAAARKHIVNGMRPFVD